MVSRGEIPETDFSSRPQGRWSVPLGWAVALVTYAVLTGTGLVADRNAVWLTDAAWTIAAGIATIATWRTSRLLDGHRRRAWRVFALACLVWLGGQLVWDWNELVQGVAVPFPTIGDLGFIGFGVLFTVGLFLLRASHGFGRLTPQRAANLGLIICSFAVVIFALVLHPIARTPHSIQFITVALLESLSVVLAFIFAVYFMWSYRWGRDLAPLVLITLALLCQAISFLIYAHELILDEFATGDLINAGWLVAFAFQHWAASVQARVATHRDGRSQLLSRGEGWIEALVPGFLLSCVAFAMASLVEHLLPRVIVITSMLLAVFAAILAFREAWMYSRGQQLQARLQSSNAALHAARTELLQTGEQRLRLEREVQFLARAGGVGLWDWDLPTNTVHFSQEWKRQLGYDKAGLGDEAREWRTLLHPDDLERVNSALQEYLHEPTGEFSIETRLRHRDGSYRWVLSQAAVLLDEAGKPVRMLGSHVDITTRKETEFALRESETRYRTLVNELELRVADRTTDLMEAYRESRSFAYAVAHDLKSPLRAIDSFSHLLQESARARLTDTEIGLVARVRGGAMHMASLIEGLLEYSRIEHFAVRIEPVALKGFLADLLEPLQDQISACHAQVQVAVPAAVTVRADRQGLAVVARNLLENALKFTRTTAAPHIQIGAQPGVQAVVIWIKDNGIGFEQTYHEKIFEIFQRLHRGEEYEGTGIGLALARKAMQRMRGRIWAVSAPGEGATFYLELPLGALDDAIALAGDRPPAGRPHR